MGLKSLGQGLGFCGRLFSVHFLGGGHRYSCYTLQSLVRAQVEGASGLQLYRYAEDLGSGLGLGLRDEGLLEGSGDLVSIQYM